MRVLLIAGLLLLLLVGCRSILGIEELPPPPQAVACASSEDCPAPTPVCLVAEERCVECTAEDSASCTGATPVCAPDHTCTECRAHTDCTSQVCLPDGRCADEADVAYVDGAAPTTATACTRAAPCHQLTLALAVSPARPVIKVMAGMVVEDSSRSIFNRTVTIVADPGAVLTRTGTGDFLRVEGGAARVTIQDLAVANIQGSGAAVFLRDGELLLDRVEISNNGIGVRVGGGALRLARSRITRNRDAGLSIDNNSASFEVVGNDFLGNGNAGSISGAVRINNAQGPVARLELNSFYGNLAGGRGAAIDCDGPLVLRNNLVSGAVGAPPIQQLSGNCTHAYSIFYLLSNPLPAGTNNRAEDPQFVDPANGDLHIKASSPAVGSADPGTLFDALSELDRDGDRRAAPADIGADETP
ncbi:MAG TPA: right-handed parallel beta-helix repeat-containing protein [Kofleriaceae bacterium]|nr:right-handed parallel beta-helix repeat-containing protein [Kofleriaceae bacterium]